MKPDKVIVFDIWGRYAHFKKIYVTTSALTYAVPFKTSIYGLVGAILGLDNNANKYLSSFNETNCKIAIQIINPIKVQRFNINLSDKPGPIKGNRKPTMMEYLVNPCYRIFFWHSDESLRNNLLNNLKEQKTVYTPVLGLAHCLANFKFIGEFEINKNSGNSIINSVIQKSKLRSFDTSFWNDNEIHIQEQGMYPLEMNVKREVTKRDSILFDLSGNSIKAEVDEFHKVTMKDKERNIMLM